jgi:hypothetical protein
MCARVGPAHMRSFPAKGMDGNEGRCVRLAHMWPFLAKRMVGKRGRCVRLAHMQPFRANAMAGNMGKCVRLAHMCRLSASCSRTCVGFRPGNQLADGKPGEVRELGTEKWQETGGCAHEMPGNRGMCARTSAGFVPSGRKTGRNQGEVRESMAQTRGKCVRSAHMRPLLAKGMVGNKGMCVRATHMRPLRAKGMARTRHLCVPRRAERAGDYAWAEDNRSEWIGFSE